MRSWLDWLFPPREDERIVRELTTETFRALVAPVEASVTRAQTLALLPLGDPRVRAVIHEAKYRGSEKAFALLADALAAALARRTLGPEPARFIPVPLGPQRLKDRGYNQVEEVLKRTALPLLPETLRRVRETESQVSLPRARRLENMRGAFAAPRPLDPAFLYIVVDDVTTTGATLEAALEALKAAGAERFMGLAFAR
jgi:predicted amidophosphoribosyltransferase